MRTLTRRGLLVGGLGMTLLPRSGRAATSPVYLMRTPDRAEGIRRGLAALGLPSVRDRRVVIKPNLNSADEFPASTHPETLAALVRHCQGQGARGVVVADRSGMGDTRRVMERKGVFRQAAELGFRAVVLDELGADGWVEERLPGGHWSRGVLFPAIVREADVVIQTCCLKTHRFGGHFTLSLKNSVGLVAKHAPRDRYNYMNELHGSAHQRRMIAELNQLYHPPAVVVMDGLLGFRDGGPESGALVRPEVVVLGADRVAVDAVGIAILRLHGGNATINRGGVFEQEQLARAVELGLGARGPAEIDLVTDDPESGKLADRVRQILAA